MYLDKRFRMDDHIYFVHEYGLDMENCEIYVQGEEKYADSDTDGVEPGVEYLMAGKFIKNMNLCMGKTGNENILVHLKSCGGMWEEGMAMYDIIQTCPNFVTGLNYTHARSMTSLIFLACDKRVMMPHSTFMIHEGTFSQEGTVKQARTEYAELMRTNEQMIDVYVDTLKSSEHGKMRTKSKKAIREWVRNQMNNKEEVYFSAKEAVELGFAHEIFDGDWSKVSAKK